MQSHIRKVYACLAVTCHPRFWQNDRGLLRATAVTRGWNGYRNKSQHRKLTLEKKILPPLQQGFEPTTFQSWVRCSNHWSIPAPQNMHTKINRIMSVGPQPHSCRQFRLSCPGGHTADRVMHSTVPKVSCLLNSITLASHLLTCFTDILTSLTSAYLLHACLSVSHCLTIFISAYPFNIYFSVSHLLLHFTPAHLFHTCLPFHTCLTV